MNEMYAMRIIQYACQTIFYFTTISVKSMASSTVGTPVSRRQHS